MKKQVLCGALAVAAASFVAISAQGTDASAAMYPDKISLNCEEQTLSLKSSAASGNQFFVGTGKYAAKGPTLKVASWEIYNKDDEVTVDLSKLNKQADNYLVIKDAPTGEPVIIKIPAVDKTVAATYDKGNGKINVTTGKKVAAPNLTGEYRSSASSKWTEVTTDGNGVATIKDISMYQRLGATLYYRVKAAKANCSLADLTADDKKSETLAFDGGAAKEYTIYNVPAFSGVEKKVTVAALAKGPKITIDYSKRQATFVKATEYRFIPKSMNYLEAANAAYTAVEMDTVNPRNVAKVTIPDDVLKDGGYVESRIAAVTEGAKLNLASKVTQTYFNAKNTTVVADKKDITTDQSVTIDSELSLTSAPTYSTARGKVGWLQVTFSNASANKYEYLTVAPAADGEAVAAPAADAKISGSIAARSAKTGAASKKALILAPGTKIYVRQASVNPSKTVAIGVWSTDWAEVATIAAKPADPTPEPTESPDVPVE